MMPTFKRMSFISIRRERQLVVLLDTRVRSMHAENQFQAVNWKSFRYLSNRE